MKTKMIRGFTLTLFATTCMFAADAHRATVQIPFGFHVGSKILPAGQYTVAAETDTGLVYLRSRDTKSAVMVLTHSIRPQTKSDAEKLVFNRYGNEYFLSTIWGLSGVDGRLLPKTRQEMKSAANASPGLESIMARK